MRSTAEAGPTPFRNGTCPSCASPNGCMPAACGTFDVDCWCASATISPGALARVAGFDRVEACLCATCARGAFPEAGHR